MFKQTADRTPIKLNAKKETAWQAGRGRSHVSFMASVEKAVLVYIVAVLVPFGYVALVDYSTPVLGQAFTWTYFNIFPWNFVLFSFLFLAGGSWIFWALSYTQMKTGERLLIEGPYSLTRNPKGFGYMLILVGLGVLLQSAIAIFIITPAIVTSYFLYLRILQEPLMRHKYGAMYEQYRTAVPLLLPYHPGPKR
ncbi:MAG: hypothetical protein M1422_03440 [Candidatus Thermoplasmatota archaeon]|nr:hypothetical protein [Candidatus Thermoplasmatota archaeon]